MSASDVPRLKVRLGDHDINSGSEAVTQDVGVANIIKHKGFSQRTLVSIDFRKHVFLTYFRIKFFFHLCIRSPLITVSITYYSIMM